MIAATDWRLDLDDHQRRLRPLPRRRGPPAARPAPADAAALRAEGDAGLMALLEDLQCPVVNRIGGGLSNNSKPYQALLFTAPGCACHRRS